MNAGDPVGKVSATAAAVAYRLGPARRADPVSVADSSASTTVSDTAAGPPATTSAGPSGPGSCPGAGPAMAATTAIAHRTGA